MGRKIPGKKHKGVKDPHEQAVRRFATVADKINRPPSCPEKQEVPKSVQRIMDFQQKSKQIKKKKKEKRTGLASTADFLPKDIELPGMSRPVKSPAVISQKPGESNHHFLYRVELACQKSLREAKFESEFKVQVKRDPETGDVIRVEKDKKNEIDKMIEKMHAKKNAKKKETLKKSEKFRAKLVAKEEIRQEKKKVRDFSDFKDEVKFGEVVHRPPELSIAPKVKAKLGSSQLKPGQKDLLLKTMLDGRGDEDKNMLGTKVIKKKAADSMARKKMLEEERKRVVEMYRLMKSKNNVKI